MKQSLLEILNIQSISESLMIRKNTYSALAAIDSAKSQELLLKRMSTEKDTDLQKHAADQINISTKKARALLWHRAAEMLAGLGSSNTKEKLFRGAREALTPKTRQRILGVFNLKRKTKTLDTKLKVDEKEQIEKTKKLTLLRWLERLHGANASALKHNSLTLLKRIELVWLNRQDMGLKSSLWFIAMMLSLGFVFGAMLILLFLGWSFLFPTEQFDTDNFIIILNSSFFILMIPALVTVKICRTVSSNLLGLEALVIEAGISTLALGLPFIAIIGFIILTYSDIFESSGTFIRSTVLAVLVLVFILRCASLSLGTRLKNNLLNNIARYLMLSLTGIALSAVLINLVSDAMEESAIVYDSILFCWTWILLCLLSAVAATLFTLFDCRSRLTSLPYDRNTFGLVLFFLIAMPVSGILLNINQFQFSDEKRSSNFEIQSNQDKEVINSVLMGINKNFHPKVLWDGTIEQAPIEYVDYSEIQLDTLYDFELSQKQEFYIGLKTPDWNPEEYELFINISGVFVETNKASLTGTFVGDSYLFRNNTSNQISFCLRKFKDQYSYCGATDTIDVETLGERMQQSFGRNFIEKWDHLFKRFSYSTPEQTAPQKVEVLFALREIGK